VRVVLVVGHVRQRDTTASPHRWIGFDNRGAVRWNVPSVERPEVNFLSELTVQVSTDAFQQVILDPENFARYNDGVIQAALLRCARAGELDYSMEPNRSQFMLDLLTNIFLQHDRRQGEAAAEFAFAIFSKRLRLKAKHGHELKEMLRNTLPANTARLQLIRALLELDPLPDAGSLPTGF
jgi:hypothetical protein